jgi:hypothetical protein
MKHAAILFAAALCGCGAAPQAPVVRVDRMGAELASGEPVWIAFEPGDVVPLYFHAGGALFETEARDPMRIKVKRRFYLLLNDGTPRISFDRETFADGGGSFRFGLGRSKERGHFAEIEIHHAPGTEADQESDLAPSPR